MRRIAPIVTWVALCASVTAARGDDGAEPPKPSTKPKLSGFVQFFYKHRFDGGDAGDDVEPGLFRLQRVRVRVEGKIVPWARYQVEIDPRSPTIFGVLRDAFIELRVIPRHRIRLGQQKTQFGWENRESSSRLYTVTRSEVSEGPARGVTLRDVGIGLIGRWPLGGGFAIEDALTVVNGAGMNVQADDTATKNVWARLGGRYRNEDAGVTVRIGASVGIGDQTEPEDPGPPVVPAYVLEFVRFGADLQVDTPWAFAAAEWVTSSESSPTNPDAENDYQGYYVLVAGKTPWDVGPVARYDVLELEEFARWTFGVYAGAPDAALRAMTTFEIFEDEAGPHDHRLFLWTQLRF